MLKFHLVVVPSFLKNTLLASSVLVLISSEGLFGLSLVRLSYLEGWKKPTWSEKAWRGGRKQLNVLNPNVIEMWTNRVVLFVHLNKLCEIHTELCRPVNVVTEKQFSSLIQTFLQESKELEISNRNTSSLKEWCLIWFCMISGIYRNVDHWRCPGSSRILFDNSSARIW